MLLKVSSVLTAGLASGLAGCSMMQPIRVASAYTSHMICSGTFVSGLDPDELYAESIKTMPGFGLIDPLLRYQVDAANREVTTSLVGGFTSRAVFREGLGCTVVHDNTRLSPPSPQDLKRQIAPPRLADIAGPQVVAPINSALKEAIDRAFAEPGRTPRRLTKVVVVVRDGRVIGERYAAGYGIDTPLIGNSLTKSVISALVAILVRDGQLAVEQPAPASAWRNPNDPRHRITIDNLLRHTSGLALDETGSGFDSASRMLMLETDMAGFAQAAPLEASPGGRWRYTSGNYIVLSRLLRDAVGGNADAVLRFAHRELFDPLGMRSVTLEFDETGTPIGSTFMFASARDWARFGMLYLNDGVVGGRRILPEGWVRFSSSPTPGAFYGYAAGFWTNLNRVEPADGRKDTALPPDMFFANGRLGQFILIVPSERLVVVRLGVTQQPPLGDDGGISRLLADVISAVRTERGAKIELDR